MSYIRINFISFYPPYRRSRQKLKMQMSSGTIKGNNLFNAVIFCLLGGGYLIIDEVENHFNKKIIELLMSIFMNQTLNTKGSVLILSTHYIELLDALRFSDEIKRNDIKKSDIMEANKIMGSAPKYEMVNSFVKFLIESKKSSLGHDNLVKGR